MENQLKLTPQFRRMNSQQRFDFLTSHIVKDKNIHDSKNFIQSHTDITKLSDCMTESAVGIMAVPMGIVNNLLVNNTYYHVPIATEEASVCAAASFGARIIGNITASSSHSLQDAQIALVNVSHTAEKALVDNFTTLSSMLMKKMKSMHDRGGGLRNLSYYRTQPNIFVLVATFDTCDAMGANAVNTAVESIVPTIEKITHTTVLSAIVSNFTDSRFASAQCSIPLERLSSNKEHAESIALKIQHMYLWAQNDIRRAVTHNKGILNGISGFALASGNDTRALEAASHAWASINGHYRSLSQFIYDEKNKQLQASLKIPAMFATIGGATNHPSAKWVRHVLAINSKKKIHAHTLNYIAAALGLAQNFAALRALVTEGIQKGHMQLHTKREK